MINFGYTLSKNHQIDLDLVDPKIIRQIRKVEPSFSLCMSCGTCSATCTANVHQKTNLMKAILMTNRGEYFDALKELKNCMLCGKCQMICPRGVNTRSLIFKLVNILEKEVNHAI